MGALEIEGELSSGISATALDVCAALFADRHRGVERVVDFGSGPGVDAAMLAERFPDATVVAADASVAMLARAASRARRLGVSDRFETRVVDLDGDLEVLGTCDLAWSAMAVHHAQDEVETLRRIGGLLRPAGLVCLLERADPLSIRLADELGRPGLWERVDGAQQRWFERVRGRLAGAMNAERYPDMLSSAGLDLVASRTLAATVTVPPDPAMRDFLSARLRAIARDVADHADAADVDALTAIADVPDERWDGATVTSTRRLFVAQPAASRTSDRRTARR